MEATCFIPWRCCASPFDHPDFVYELKLDGFGAIALIEHGQCHLVSRNGHDFKQWPSLNREIAGSVRCRSAVLDGEIVCLDPDGRSNFYSRQQSVDHRGRTLGDPFRLPITHITT